MPEMVLVLIRSLSSFSLLLLFTRLLGKKQLSQMSFFDYIVGISIGSLAAVTAIDLSINMLHGVAGLLVFTALPMMFDFLSQQSYRFRQFASGHPKVLIYNGKILEENVKKEKMTIDDLMVQLRNKGAFRLSDVEFAVMEENGSLSVMKKADAEPVTPKALGISAQQEPVPRIVLMDGNVLGRTLQSLGYTEEWLLEEVRRQGAKGFEEVFLAQMDAKGNVYVDLYEERQQQP